MKRIVFDEFHELREEESDELGKLPLRAGVLAQHRWGLTGTPPTTCLEEMTDAVTLLNLEIGCAAEAATAFCTEGLRTNGLDAAQAVAAPEEHVVDVALTPVEQALYLHKLATARDEHSEDTYLAVQEGMVYCNAYETPARGFESAGAAFAELRSSLEAQVASTSQKLRLAQGKARAVQLKLDTGHFLPEERAQLRGERDEADDRAANLERDHALAVGARDRLQRLSDQVENGFAPRCPLCVDGCCAERAAACGHALCANHMQDSIERGTCPVCSAGVIQAEVTPFRAPAPTDPKRFGAKLFAVVEKLRELLVRGSGRYSSMFNSIRSRSSW